MNTYDYGKWIYGLNTTNYIKYDFIVFTNDSFIIQSNINHFFNLTYKYNLKLYGYNDSISRKYHYQSYLFSLRKDAIQTFINNYEKKKSNILNQTDVILNYEIQMVDWYKDSHNCFLKIGNLPSKNKYGNIFFTNDKLYGYLQKTKLLPFIKVKRILADKKKR